MNDMPREEIWFSRSGQFTMPGDAFALHTTLTAQTLCISVQGE